MAICALSGTVIDGGGGPIVEASVVAKLREGDNPAFDAGGALVSDGEITSTTDGNGDFTINLVQGLTYVIDIWEANYHKQVTIPETSTANLKDL